MARVKCSVEETDDIEDEETGREVDGVRATCSKCGHTTESFGVEEDSIRRCLAMMRKECPQNENNFYFGDKC